MNKIEYDTKATFDIILFKYNSTMVSLLPPRKKER